MKKLAEIEVKRVRKVKISTLLLVPVGLIALNCVPLFLNIYLWKISMEKNPKAER